MWTATITLPMPFDFNTSEAKTDYANVRFKNVRAYLLPQENATAGGPVQLYLTKNGISYFLNDDLDLMVFTHLPVKRGQFVYESTQSTQNNMCPLSSHTCGDALCA